MTTETATNPVEGGEKLFLEGVEGDDANGGTETDLGNEGETEGEGDDSQPEGEAQPVEEIEEVEHDGKKYKVPKELVPALLRNADYTRKTQELADERRALADAKAQHVELSKETLALRGSAVALEAQIAKYANVDWEALRASDRDSYQEHRERLRDLKEALGETTTAIQKADETAALETQRQRATRLQEAQAVLAKDIPGWGADLAGKLADFAIKNGFTAKELGQVEDPRIVKLLHRAMTAETQAKTQAKVAQVAAGQKTQPAQQVRGQGGQFAARPDTNDFAAFEQMADAKLKKRA